MRASSVHVGRASAIMVGIFASCAATSCFAASQEDVFQSLLGAGKRVRDSVSFTTEKGEAAALVLYVTDVQAFGGQRVELEAPLSCPEQVPGIPLAGVYHVALVIDGKLINEITLSPPGGGSAGPMALPLRNLPRFNYEHWGQGGPAEDDDQAQPAEPTKLLRLADYNGDGRAWEFRLVQWAGACGHLSTLAAGYSAARRAVVVFPIESGPFRSEWADDFFPHPSLGAGSNLETTFPCGDGGNEREVWQEYQYDAGREVWVLKRHRERDCGDSKSAAEEAVEALDPPIALTIGSVEGAPGERVNIPVSIDTRKIRVERVAHSIVVDPRISVAAIAGLDLESTDSKWTAADNGIGPIHCRSELVESCEWAFSMRLDGDFLGASVLYALQLQVPADAAPGSYPLRNVDAVASATGKRWPITGADGELRVRAPRGK